MSDAPKKPTVPPAMLAYSDLIPFYDFRTFGVLVSNPATVVLPGNPYRIAVGFSIDVSPASWPMFRPGAPPEFIAGGFYAGFALNDQQPIRWFHTQEYGPMPAAEWWGFAFAAPMGVMVSEILWNPTRGR